MRAQISNYSITRLALLFHSKGNRDGDNLLKLLIASEEFLVCVSNQLALIAPLPFVHTARRSYRSNGPANNSECNAC